MATLFKASGGVIGSLRPTITDWVTPNGLFPTSDRNDGSAYSWSSSTSTVTLPSSDLADGYLFVAAFEIEATSNGRCAPQGKIIQASGTGTFVGPPAGGYLRDTSEDRAYVRCWGFVDGPSASATFTFQWKRDDDDINTTDGTVRSEFQVIPFYYSNIGMYTSNDGSFFDSTTPVVVGSWTTQTESDTAAIERSTNVINCKGDNSRYLILGGQFWETRGGNTRTQRWAGLDIDGTQEKAAQGCIFFRQTSADENGHIFTWLIETVTATVTVEQTCYRGDGELDLEGGCENAGSAATEVGTHGMVVIELNSSAEVFRSRDTNQSALLATTGPVDLDCNETTDFNDTGSFTDLAVSSINCVKTNDYLFGANVACASNSVADTSRWTAYSELTINGTEDSDSFNGNYLRNNNATAGTFGWSASLLGFQAITAGDDVGVSVTELSGSEGGGAAVSPAGWTGFWGINIDTLDAVAPPASTTILPHMQQYHG